jgi:hypothetical protein
MKQIAPLQSSDNDDFSYQLTLDVESHTITLSGKFRLQSYTAIYDWLMKAYAEYSQMTHTNKPFSLDFTETELINSSGISIICDFLEELEESSPDLPLIFIGKQDGWQRKSFGSFQDMNENLQVKFV